MSIWIIQTPHGMVDLSLNYARAVCGESHTYGS